MSGALITAGLGIDGVKLDTAARILDDATEATAEAFATTNAAVMVAFLCVIAAALAKISPISSADLFHAISLRIRNGSDSAALDTRRIARAASALFEAAQRKGL